jgi:[methyl-Co(III) methanol-specific corrinoid protein]:coenzyme M methyltransferase
MREEILSLLSGQKFDQVPTFSGLIHVTAEGLKSEELLFHEIHHDAAKMARAAASTFRLTGMPSAALPLDLCAPAEALGQELKFYGNDAFQFPQPARPLFASTTYLNKGYMESADFVNQGRIPMICHALRSLKSDIGQQVVISGIVPGPYTLLLYLIEPGGLFAEMKREPNAVLDALFHLSSFLSSVAQAYRSAGADYITIHDMGGSPGFIGPAKYEQFVLPAEMSLIGKLPRPRVLSVCGNATGSLGLLNQTGVDAISIDQTTDLAKAREALKDTLLFGNIDPVQTLWQGDEAQVVAAAQRAKEVGVDAVWPGCDLVVQTPIQNMKRMLKT